MTTLQELQALKCPEVPEQQQTDEECCEAELKVVACCRNTGPFLRSRTISVDIPAATEQNIQAQVTSAANGLEANGWIILGHSWNFVVGEGGAVATVNLGYYA